MFIEQRISGGQHCHSSWQLRLTRLMECWQCGLMGVEGRKERRKVQRLALPDGWRRGEGERCVNWQQADRWKVRVGVWARCVWSVTESIMGCGLMVMVVLLATGLPCSNDNLWFLKCPSEPQRGLRNSQHLAETRLFHHKQGPGTLTLKGNVSKPYTTQFTLA